MDLEKTKEIELKNISEKIPSILQKKFEQNNIFSLHEALSLNRLEFAKKEYIGKKILQELDTFLNYVNNNFEDIIDLNNQNCKTYVLPLAYDEKRSNSLLEIIQDTIIDYINFDSELNRSIILHTYGLNNAKKYSFEELGTYHNKVGERIRQIKISTLTNVDLFLEGRSQGMGRLYCNEKVVESYLNLKRCLNQKRVYNLESFIESIDEDFKGNVEIIFLLIDLLKFTICGQVESRFTEGTLVLTKEENKKEFLKCAEIVFKVLRKEITPINQMQLIISCKKKSKKLSNSDIIDAVETLPEIEIIQADQLQLYQIKFEKISSAADRAYRILVENGNAMYVDNIVSEINSRLVNSNTEKIYDRYSLALASDNRFSAQGKTGFWSLKIWNVNASKIEIHVQKALYELDKPSTYQEIFEKIIIDRPELKKSSVQAIIGRDCIRVDTDKWILPQWKQRYSGLTFNKRKKREVTHQPEHRLEQRTKIFEFLEKKSSKQAAASDIIKALSQLDKRFTRISFYKIFDQVEYFDKLKIGNRNMIILKPQNKIVNIIIDEFNWNLIKPKLTRDLKEFFDDSIAPSYLFSIENSIDLFYDFLNLNLVVNEFSGLNERILGNLKKYYLTSSDRTDNLNIFKQFLSSLDPFLKKILYIVEINSYNIISRGKKGLGEIMDKLDRLDPTKERYKEIKNARAVNFGKHICRSYSNRNIDTHNAKEWTELEIITGITSSLLLYIYSCCQYYEELKAVTK